MGGKTRKGFKAGGTYPKVCGIRSWMSGDRKERLQLEKMKVALLQDSRTK